ncbi:HpcH/HpaI aldolase/citrate lyase family protein [Pseudomonas gingeri]|uniref:HpcH/HpaI aldolase/citrate lyase family protein n=1 Tax=Pseudomonas gingeri TaxID=117681 RepID=UPI001C43344F|nr:CoA ester lyase [Pseudomonas gingeri]
MNNNIPVWRSMLFIPAHRESFVLKAHTRGADAYILDLEDSVPDLQKELARRSLGPGIQHLVDAGATVLIRINQPLDCFPLDLEFAVVRGVSAIVVPKVNSCSELLAISSSIEALEIDRGLPAGQIRLIAQIEDVQALPVLDEIARSTPRLAGMILGSEDFCASVGMQASTQTLFMPNQQVLFACRRAGILPLGFPGSIADYSDEDAFRNTIKIARKMGFVGGFCIHPSQVDVMNEEFIPSQTEVERANGIISAYQAALKEGRGAAVYEGKMIDVPVVALAQELLKRALSAYVKETVSDVIDKK